MTGCSSIECIVEVPFHYKVLFTERLFAKDNQTLPEVFQQGEQGALEKCLIFVEAAVVSAIPAINPDITSYFRHHPEIPKLVCPPIVLTGGEFAKNDFALVAQVHEFVAKLQLSRHSYVMAIGGGAFLDVIGFAAATAHRGIRHIRVPTTTLSQADAGVGVKNGLNGCGKKNFIGTFTPPFAVINNQNFLDFLPDEIRRAGYIEAVKVALIRNAAFFNQIEHDAEALVRFEPAAMQRLIRRCAELHIAQISNGGDPFEFGAARPLDFGHWAAHKIEQLSRFTVPHAEAVAVGIALDVLYSRNVGYLDHTSAERILTLLQTLRFRGFALELLAVNKDGGQMILEGLNEFREHLGGDLTITLLRDIGVGFEVHEMIPAEILATIKELEQRSRNQASR